MSDFKKEIKSRIETIYGEAQAEKISDKLLGLTEKWKPKLTPPANGFDINLPLDETDTILITYGDNLREEGVAPLASLKEFADTYLRDIISGIHILPFSPFSSDDGFSVIDYRAVNKKLGDWDDMEKLGEGFKLMFDLVLNHCSVQNQWFKDYLAGNGKYKNYFIEVEEGIDLSAVFRPRALPLLHEFESSEGKKMVWTTFSEDQVDLNFSEPDVALEMLDVFLSYIEHGAQVIRLDAIGFLWKEIGTSCMHHKKTHEVVKLFRDVLREIAPWAVLISETNVPHKDNISYFGNGEDEAQMVYQFSLPPLTLDAMLRGDATHLTDWAGSLDKPVNNHTFFNFLASHDGIGVLPARGFLSEDELKNLCDEVVKRNGRISYKSTPDGDIPYELNISYRDAVAEEDLDDYLKIEKFLTAQSIMLTMAGVPGIYIHSLLGSGNWEEGITQTGMNRSINREKLNPAELEADLNNPATLRFGIFTGYLNMLRVRRDHKAFHPTAAQKIHSIAPEIFVVERGEGNNSILCIHNVSKKSVLLDCALIGGQWCDAKRCINLLEEDIKVDSELRPFETRWIGMKTGF